MLVRRHRFCALGALGLALVGAAPGCGDDAGPRQAPCDAPICVADPVPHLVCPDACERDDDCPQGTICGTASDADDPVCTPPRGPHTPSTALTEGFGVRSMEGTLVTTMLPAPDGSSDAGAELGWKAPGSASVVTCALLACPPVVVDGTIANYDQCVLARGTSEQVVGSFALTDAEREHPLPAASTCADGSVPAFDTHDRFPVTELLVGCWAYDDTRMIAATRLRRPAAAQIHDFHDGFDLDCRDAAADGGAAAEGRTCVLGDGTMGSCVEGACHRRCLRDADCGEGSELGATGSCDADDRVGLVSLCVDPGPTRPVEDE